MGNECSGYTNEPENEIIETYQQKQVQNAGDLKLKDSVRAGDSQNV